MLLISLLVIVRLMTEAEDSIDRAEGGDTGNQRDYPDPAQSPQVHPLNTQQGSLRAKPGEGDQYNP